MKNTVVAILLTLNLTSTALAARDSVAVFHRSEKVVVLLNERGSEGRLQQFMNALGAEDRLYWTRPDEGVKMDCGRNTVEAACTFRFTPSANVTIGNKEVRAYTDAADLKKEPFEMSFTSSREDQFQLVMDTKGILIWAGKRLRTPTTKTPF